MVPTTTSAIVCDLCGKPVDTYAGNDRYNLQWGLSYTRRDRAKPGWMHFAWSWWARHRTRAHEINDDLKRDDVSVAWDFHGQCLVRTLRPIVEQASANAEVTPAPVGDAEVEPS